MIREIPFDSALARHLWKTSLVVRERRDLSEDFRGEILRRFEQFEQLVTDRAIDLLVGRVIDCRPCRRFRRACAAARAGVVAHRR
jgi:hypothetical protein